MKKIGNIICTVLIIIGAIVAICYATHKEEQPFKEGFNGFNEKGIPVYYYDFGQTESREQERKIVAGVGFGVYSLAIIGGRYFISLKKKTKEEIKKMENTQGSDFLL